jgi:hypothetical protein
MAALRGDVRAELADFAAICRPGLATMQSDLMRTFGTWLFASQAGATAAVALVSGCSADARPHSLGTRRPSSVRVVSDFIAGVLAILVGLVFCYQGYLALRIAITVWGGFVGFALGASIGRDDQGILGTALSWILGLVLALVFAALAYLYYEVSIALAVASIGFLLGTSLLVALGVTWSWFIVLAGLALGIALAVVALLGDLPTVLLIVLSSMAGASVIVAGVMLLSGALDSDDITRSSQITDELHDDWYWYVMYLGLAISGIVVQLRSKERRAATMREAWAPQTTQPA